ncbi:MAG: hypothetical protein OXI63_01800 [Candidatus Poribacteria bacterium]|nr:hypothetical protein [Candidatus Poribacteria bacterium]
MKRKAKKQTQHQFLCRTCGEVHVAPRLGTAEDRAWRQAWQDEGRVACCECLGVFHHELVSMADDRL